MAAHPLYPAVATLMRRVAADIVLPRFRNLATGEVMEKAPGDLVTVADRLSEAALADGLRTILPHARVVGEEGCAAVPALLDGLAHGIVWIVDPIDGTHNYADGIATFALMVALVEDGVTQAGWILDPVAGRMCHAALGGGAFVDDMPVRTRPTGIEPPVAALANHYLPPEIGRTFATRADGRFTDAAPPRCAGEQYPRLVLGINDVALFWNARPWDHAPGALFLTEAGGRIAWFDGEDYGVGRVGQGLIAAASPDLWARTAAVLLDR